MGADSVCAILRDIEPKTQTRRLVRWQPYDAREKINLAFSGLEAGYYFTGVPTSGWVLRSRGAGGCWNDRTKPVQSPYGAPGDRLWVRETWATEERAPDMVDGIWYRADDSFRPIEATPAAADAWVVANGNRKIREARSPIYMPRWASRITLEVVEVRVERLMSITETDARAEGFSADPRPGTVNGKPASVAFFNPRIWYAYAWNALNEKRAPWLSNPFVWAVTFRRVTS